MPENSLDLPAYAYIPFAAGRRNCIGQKFAMMELKTVVAYMLRKFHIKCDQSIENIQITFEVVTRSANPIIFELNPRE